MKTYMIGYDLIGKPEKDYEELMKAIKAISEIGAWHCLDSTWLIKSSKNATQIRDALKPHLHKDDRLLVASLDGVAAWTGFDTNCADWLRTNL